MNEITTLKAKLDFKVDLVEKPYFYTDGINTRSSQFKNSKKVYLEEVVGEDFKSIIADLNQKHINKQTAIVYIGRDQKIAQQSKNGKISIQCLIM